MPYARPAAALAGLLAVLGPAPARAAEPRLRHGRADLAVVGISLGTSLALELLKGRLAPPECRVCGGNGLDDRARRLLVWSHPERARLASNVTVGALPAAAAGWLLLAGRRGPGPREGAWDGVIVAEAASLALGLTSAVKLAAGRQRPFAAHGDWPEADRKPEPDDNLSFWSGHTAFSFAVATSAGTLASMRGRHEAPWVWSVGLTTAAAVGWLRIGADKHHLTDVLAGAAVGTALGIGVPRLLHGEREAGSGPSVALVPLPMGLAGTF
jgi:membrane-associated phospholipid phosphatase